MSVLARYFSSRRRRPTSSRSPRRLWWSCLCTLRCSVRSAMRLVSIATCTSGEPVSPSTVAYSAMILFLLSVSSAMISLFSTGVCQPRSRGVVQARGAAVSSTSGQGYQSGPATSWRRPIRARSAGQDPPGLLDVLADLREHRLHLVVPAHLAQVGDEVQGH